MENQILNEQNYVGEIIDIIRQNLSDAETGRRLEQYHDNDIAEAFSQLDAEERKRLYRMLDSERISDIFTYIDDVEKYIGELEINHAAEIIDNMDSDDAVDVLEEMDEETAGRLVSLIGAESSRDINLIRSYDEDEIGSKMTTNFIEIKKNISVKQAMKELISQAEENDNITTIYVCDEDGRFFGALDLKDLIIAREYTKLDTLISTSYPYVRDCELISECLERIIDYAEDSIPVLDNDNRILGVITSQDIVEVVDDELGDDYAKLAGLTEEEDLNEPLFRSVKKRMPWLVVLLFLGMGVSTVVGMFESVVAQIAIIVSFQSLILGMAGNGGTQSLAITIRVLMDEQLHTSSKIKLIFKEVRIGLCNGMILGVMSFLLIGLYIMFMKHKPMLYAFSISGCVGLALIVSMVISSLVGTVVPMFFNKINVDPAVASGPLITTINDLVAVVAYYGTAWVLLINLLNLT